MEGSGVIVANATPPSRRVAKRVLVGGNVFDGCETLISLRGTPMLRVDLDPLEVLLVVPEDVPAGGIRVVPGEPLPVRVRIVATDRSHGVFRDDQALVLATLLDDGAVHLRVDLRPVGVNLYDDAAGLHIAGMTFRGSNTRSCAVAISLGP